MLPALLLLALLGQDPPVVLVDVRETAGKEAGPGKAIQIIRRMEQVL